MIISSEIVQKTTINNIYLHTFLDCYITITSTVHEAASIGMRSVLFNLSAPPTLVGVQGDIHTYICVLVRTKKLACVNIDDYIIRCHYQSKNYNTLIIYIN